MKIITSIVLFLVSISATYSQTNEAVEKDLLTHLISINRLGTAKNQKPDSLKYHNQQIKQKLLKYTANQISTITYAFPLLQKEHMGIVTSVDGNFRIYTWDTYLGGSSHVYDHLYQYKFSSKTYSKPFSYIMKDGEYTGKYLDIVTIDSNNPKIYLGYFYNVFPGKMAFQGVKTFTIEKNTLNDTCSTIMTPQGYKNQIGFKYDYSHVHETRDQPHNMFQFHLNLNEFSFPVALDNGELTNRHHVFKYNGTHFEKIQKKGKGNTKH